MPGVLSEVEEHAVQERSVSDGPSNPMSQHAYEGFAKRQRKSGPGSGLFLGVAAAVLVLVLASIFGLWLVRSVRRLNAQVARLSRQSEQLDRRVQAAEKQATASAQQASQAAADAQAAALQRDQANGSTAAPAAPAASAPQAGAQKQPAQAQPAAEPTAATAKGAHSASSQAENRNPREEKLQKLQQSLGQIAETHLTANGLVMTLGEKSIRFDSGRADVAPQYRAILNRTAAVLKPLKGYSFYVYGYTDDNGTKDYNLTLSARRARAVRDGLVKAGVDRSLISTKGLGNSKPLVRGTAAKARAANHRIEIGIAELTTTTAQSATVSKTAAKP